MRVSIIGLSSSGKTTLAEAISKKFSIPHIQLDRFWFESGGLSVNRWTSDREKERIREYIQRKVSGIINADSWVSDGFYSHIQPHIADRADTVVFLDISLWRRLINHALRILRPATRHKELKIWNELTFFFEIIRRTFVSKQKYKKFLNDYGHKTITLRSRKEIMKYLDGLLLSNAN